MPAYSQDSSRVGTLIINNTQFMPSSWWRTRNPQVLWLPAPMRGDDMVIPGKDGVLGRTRRKASRTVTLEIYINGTVSSYNANETSPSVCLFDNLNALRVRLFDLPAGAPTEIKYTAPGESQKTVNGHALSLEEVDTDPMSRWMLVELDLLLLPGEFTATP